MLLCTKGRGHSMLRGWNVKHLVSDLLSSFNQVQALRHRRISQLLQLAAGFPTTSRNLDEHKHLTI